MINDYKFRMEVQNTVENYILQLMNANNIPASLMEDALNKVMLGLKDRQFQEYIISLEQAKQEAIAVEETEAAEEE